LECDLTDAARAERAAEETRSALGPISVLVNAVGVAQPHALFVDMPPEQWAEVIRVNVLAPVNCMRAVLDDMRGLGGGVIINLCSIWSTRADARYRSAYIASKWALLGATRAVATEVVQDGVRVCAVSPGPVDSPMTRDMAPAAVRSAWLKPADVASTVRYAISNAQSLVGGEIQIFGSARPDPLLADG
jgi:NAD(P)-dependent dehydrogenase (short-subunit alcohol dehydrogenase family)